MVPQKIIRVQEDMELFYCTMETCPPAYRNDPVPKASGRERQGRTARRKGKNFPPDIEKQPTTEWNCLQLLKVCVH